MSTPINMAHRSMMDPLRSGQWTLVKKVQVQISARSLIQMLDNGWIVRRGEGNKTEIRLTDAGLKALKAPLARNAR